MKLKKLLEEMGAPSSFGSQKPEKTIGKELKLALETIGGYNGHGKSLKREIGLPELSKKLKETVDLASKIALENLNEDEWFERKTVERNMNEAKKHAAEFEKIASDAHKCEMQLEALFDEIGHKLGRYYEIKDLDVETNPIIK